MIEFDEAGFSRGRFVVLQDLTLTLSPGAFHVLYGEPGSGKTTFLRLCRLDLAPTSGSIRFFGGHIDPRNRNAVADLRRSLGVLETEPGFLDHLPVAANVALPLTAGGFGAAGRADDLRALLEWTDLGGLADALPTDLTRGERQRAALARALILSPALLLADDPTAGLDPAGRERMLGLLVDLHRMGKTILLATADAALIHDAADRTALRLLHLAGGRISDPEAGDTPRASAGAGAER